MVKIKSMLRFLALLVLSLWAQNASAASFSCTGGNIYWNRTGFVNTTTSTCTYDIGTVYAPGGATQDGYTIITSPHLALNVSGITVTFINNGAPYAPTSKSLSCFIGVGTPGLGPFGATINTPMANTVTANSITANFPAFALSEGYYNLDCTVNYVNAAGESVSHSFLGSGYQPAIGVVGNASTYGTSTVNITAAPVEPSVALAGLSGTIGAGAQTVTATFSKEVTGFTAADLSVTNASVSNFSASSTSVYTFDITPAATGAVLVQVPASSVTDLAGNANTASNTLSATADLTPPRVSFSGLPAPALLYTGVTQTITATFSEAVTGFTLSDLVAVGATVSNFVVVNPTTYRFDALPTGATAVSIGVSLLSVSDLVGNLNSIADPAFTARNAGQPTPISASFTITPSAGVSSVIAVFTDTSTPTSSLTLTSWAWDFGDGNTSTLQNPAHYYTTQGVYTVTLQACDTSGCSTATGTVTVSSALSSLTSTLSGLTGPIGTPQTITVVLSNDLDDAALGGLTLSDFSSTNLTLSALTLVSRGPLATDPQTFTLTATPNGNGPVSITLPSGTVKNRAGALNAASNTLSATADVTQPTVGISGLPAEITGPTTVTATITFSKAVTGFTAADITISGGTVTALSGSGAVYTASVSATGANDLAMSIAADVAQDAAGNGNLASATVTSVNVTATQTSADITHFMQSRANALLENQPDLAGFLRGGAGQFAAEVTRAGGSVAFDSGTDGPIWARLNANWSTDLGAQGEYVFGVLGAHSRLSSTFLLGGMLQFDHLRETNGAAVTEGNGWLLGPYFVAKLPSQPLYFEGSLLYGQTANTVSPLGTYTDAFTTERWLATLGVSGEMQRGPLTLIPFLDAKYTQDAQAAYIDGLGNPIAAQRVGLGQVSAGLDVEVALAAATTLTGGVSGVWSYSSGNVLAPGYEGGRARVNVGLTHRFKACNTLKLAAFYDGIGAVDFESYGADLMWQTCF